MYRQGGLPRLGLEKKAPLTCRWCSDWEVGTVWSENVTAEGVSQRMELPVGMKREAHKVNTEGMSREVGR